jgi:hypothetical protein
MSPSKEFIINLVEKLPEEKLDTVISFIQFIQQAPTDLDAYDYELAKNADQVIASGETPISLEDACKELGVNINEL